MEIPRYIAETLRGPFRRVEGWEQKPLWLFESETGTAVLKRLAGDPRHLGYYEWELELLSKLARSGFPVQEPLELLSGDSVKVIEGAIWTTYRFVPGSAIGWEEPPSLEEQGAFLARFHNISSQIEIAPRPYIGPIETFIAEAAPFNNDLQREFDAVTSTMRSLRNEGTVVMHGDLSCDNMIGEAGVPTGVIDFGMAQHHSPLVDLGFALWRTARPARDAETLDLRRLTRYVAGYSRERPLDADDLGRIPAAILGKGLFLLRLIENGAPLDERLTRARIDWIKRKHKTIVLTIQI